MWWLCKLRSVRCPPISTELSFANFLEKIYMLLLRLQQGATEQSLGRGQKRTLWTQLPQYLSTIQLNQNWLNINNHKQSVSAHYRNLQLPVLHCKRKTEQHHSTSISYEEINCLQHFDPSYSYPAGVQWIFKQYCNEFWSAYTHRWHLH